jgi:signal transduction histidine kinase
MARQVQQLLQLAQVADVQTMRQSTVHPIQVARDVMDHLAFKANRKDVTLHLIEPATDVSIQADAGALFILIKNLAENAIEFSPLGSEVKLQIDNTGMIMEDHGPGVSAEYRLEVFERFWRAPGQTRSGSGLGLAIVREIALAHGWSLCCNDAPGGGALFSVHWQTDATDSTESY